MPTQAAPNIWYGSHGPTPPVISAEENNVVQPRAKPNPGPKTRPARTSTKNTVSRPAVPAPSGRRAAPKADRTPSIATALASMPPSASSANTTARTRTSSAPKITEGASDAASRPGATTNGQPNATIPTIEAPRTANVERRVITIAEASLSPVS